MNTPRLARPFAFIACFSLLALAACDSGGPDEERIGISGQWTGELISIDTTGAMPDTLRLPITMTLVDNTSRVTGSGTVQTPEALLAFVVPSGLFSPPNLSLELRFDIPPQGTISGIVSPDIDFINASMSGPGIVNGRATFQLVMQRME